MKLKPITIMPPSIFTPHIFFARLKLVLILAGLIIIIRAEADEVDAGFLFDRFKLTLEDGWRTEAAGPFYYSQETEEEKVWAIPPFFSCYRQPGTEAHEDNFLYPVLSHIRYGHEQRWQLGQLISTSMAGQPSENDLKRFTLFPIFFWQRSADTNLNATAFVPFYGHLQNRLFRDEMYFIMFPLYGQTTKHGIVTDNYMFPFVHVRHGEALKGWQVWPFAGDEHKQATTKTNEDGEVTHIAGHHQWFVMWPFYLAQDNNIGTENPEKIRASLPLFAISHSPQRDFTGIFWPFFATVDDRDKKYHEWQGPWPFVIWTRGEGKHTSRVWPLFSESRNGTLESDSYLWPLVIFKRTQSAPLDEKRTRVVFYLYNRLSDKSTETGKERTRVDMWPFFTWLHDFNGNEHLQVIAPLEPLVPHNRNIERNWSPLWSFWRADTNPTTHAASQSLLWNLYRRETAPARKKVSLLFGLFQYQSTEQTEQTRLFYFTVHQKPPPGKQTAN